MAANKQGINKSAFVREFPESMSARDVVAKAKERGIELSEKHVHAIRSLARHAARGPGAPAAMPKRRGRPPKNTTAADAGAPSHLAAERDLVELVLDHGLRKIEEALDEIRQRLRRTLV